MSAFPHKGTGGVRTKATRRLKKGEQIAKDYSHLRRALGHQTEAEITHPQRRGRLGEKKRNLFKSLYLSSDRKEY
jgi:hypothetical protein